MFAMRWANHCLRWTVAASLLAAGTCPALAEGGLPQLNPAVFSPQLIWLAISFLVLFLLMSKVALPDISATLTARQQRLDGDLAAAEKLRAEAEAAIAGYKKSIADARAAAQAEMKEVAASLQAEGARREAAFATEVNARTKAAEQAIAAAKQKASADIRAMAGEATRQLVTRLSGAEPAAADIASAVEAAGREKA
jgi:F-type H+-transporting ATPase subunit b